MAHAVFAAPMVFRGASSAARLTRDCDSRSSRRDVTTGASVSSRSSFVFPKREWAHMTTAEFEGVDKTRLIALLPVGAIEQHGPHLPVCVDAAINAGVLARAMELLPDDLPVCVLPPVPYGKSVEHDSFCGTLSLSAATLTAVWTDIGDSLHRAGVQKLVLFNAHGGQPQVMDIVARDLRKRHGMLVVTLSWFSFGLPESMFSDTELKHGLHAGDVETSVMLHLHPTLVQMDKARNFKSAGEVIEGMPFRNLNDGVTPVVIGGNDWAATGDASGATKEKGRGTVEHAAHKLVELLTEGTYWAFPKSRHTVCPYATDTFFYLS